MKVAPEGGTLDVSYCKSSIFFSCCTLPLQLNAPSGVINGNRQRRHRSKAEVVRKTAAATSLRVRTENRRRQTPATEVEARKKGISQACDVHSRMRCADCEHNNIDTDKCCATHHCELTTLWKDVKLATHAVYTVYQDVDCVQERPRRLSTQQCCTAHNKGASDLCKRNAGKQKKDGRGCRRCLRQGAVRREAMIRSERSLLVVR